MAELHLPHKTTSPGANKLRFSTLLKPSKQNVQVVDSSAAKCNSPKVRMKSAVSGLFHTGKRSEKGSLPVPSHGRDGSGCSNEHSYEDGRGGLAVEKGLESPKWPSGSASTRKTTQGDEQEDTDTDASECGDEEKTFFADLRRVRRGQLISAARVDLPERPSVSHLLGLFSKKMLPLPQLNPNEGGAFSTLLRKAKTRLHDSAAVKEVEGEQAKVAAEAECRGGGLCEKRVLMGRRCKGKETSNLGFLVGRTGMETSSFRAAARPERCPRK